MATCPSWCHLQERTAERVGDMHHDPEQSLLINIPLIPELDHATGKVVALHGQHITTQTDATHLADVGRIPMWHANELTCDRSVRPCEYGLASLSVEMWLHEKLSSLKHSHVDTQVARPGSCSWHPRW